MFCTNCGKEIDNNAAICIHCGVATNNTTHSVNNSGMQHHDQPKCRKCGYIGEFKREKMFRTIDWAIGLATFWFGFGIIYFIIIAIIRYDEKNRKTICPHCGEVGSAMDVY
ncbi:MAG: zinc ribbon domain-containing protein [Clostridia bacterium]|nr:zinc ribbon domain-containing protein [Clostridia bacterium]